MTRISSNFPSQMSPGLNQHLARCLTGHSSNQSTISLESIERYLLKTPSTPMEPIPSMTSLVNRNGTVSGVGRILPCSNAIPANNRRWLKTDKATYNDKDAIFRMDNLSKLSLNCPIESSGRLKTAFARVFDLTCKRPLKWSNITILRTRVTEINMNEFSRLLINQDILNMPISKP